ncbi:MAG: hypothetical protein AB9834_09715 [Lentimicrobium sp.]
METSFNERFTCMLKALEMKPVHVAQKMNVSRQVIDNYMRSTVPRFPHLVEILRAFPQVDIRWLILGEDNVKIVEETGADTGEKRGLAMWDYSTLKELWDEDRKELLKLRVLNNELSKRILDLEERRLKK